MFERQHNSTHPTTSAMQTKLCFCEIFLVVTREIGQLSDYMSCMKKKLTSETRSHQS